MNVGNQHINRLIWIVELLDVGGSYSWAVAGADGQDIEVGYR